MSFKKKLIVLGICISVLPLVLVTVVTWFLGSHLNAKVREKVTVLAVGELDKTAHDIYMMVHALDDAMKEEVSTLMVVAGDLLEKAGGASFSGTETVEWSAVDQFTKDASKVVLPKLLVGGKWLGTVRDVKEGVHVVDEFQKLAGGGYTCTIFQRMNERGDMLRVATNVIGADGKRAIGTYIPAMVEGKGNGVVSAVLRGEMYVGRAFVVDQWYTTAYRPLYDSSRSKVVGMLYVGKPEKRAFEHIRDAIFKTKVGDTGYVYVLNAVGKQKGTYVISAGGKRDGENILGAKDASGKEFIREIVERAVSMREGDVAQINYPWQNSGEAKPRMKIARYAYYEPWDWVIGVGAYEDEFMSAPNMISKNLAQNYQVQLVIVIISLVVSISILTVFGNRIGNGITSISKAIHAGSQQTREASEEISKASLSLAEMASAQASSIEETSASLEELSSMTKRNAEHAQKAKELSTSTSGAVDEGVREAQEMSRTIESVQKSSSELKRAMDGIQSASESISKVVKTIDEIAFQTNILALNAAVEAARAGEAGMGFAVVADEVRALAQRSAESAKETARLIDDSVVKSHAGVSVSQKVSADLHVIFGEVAKVTELLNRIGGQAKLVDESVGEIALASQEQSQGIGQITTAVAQMDAATQTNAATSEEAAASSEHLRMQSAQLEKAVTELYGIIHGTSQIETPGSPALGSGKRGEAKGTRKLIAKPERPALRISAPRHGNGAGSEEFPLEDKGADEGDDILKQANGNSGVKSRRQIPLGDDFKDF